MKKVVSAICLIVSVLTFSSLIVARASGETKNSEQVQSELLLSSGEINSGEKDSSGDISGDMTTEVAISKDSEPEKEIYVTSRNHVTNNSFKVNMNVDFPDLITVVYNKTLRKDEEIIHEARREILIAARVGFINGYEDGTFKPDNNVTRAEFIKMLMGLSTNRTFNFEAIPTTYYNWAGKFVTLAEMQGVIEKGKYTDETLDEPITRLEMVCMLSKVQIKMKGIQQSQLGRLVYTDISGLTEEEKGLLLHAASYDLLEGMKESKISKFEPDKNITRAEAARALVRIY